MSHTRIRIGLFHIVSGCGLLTVLIGFVMGRFTFTAVMMAVLLIGGAAVVRDLWRAFWSS